MTQTATGLFNAGLGNLCICIESRMERAGALMVHGSVRHPGWPPTGDAVPPGLLNVTVAFGGAPVVEAIFSQQEILDAHKGVTCKKTISTIDLLVEKYLESVDRAQRDAAEGRGLAR